MSSRRQASPLISYSLSPERYIRRVIETSVYSIGSAPSVLSIVSVTSARPSGARPAVPAKITSSILPPRSAFAPCSPRTQAIASTTFDLPEPFGPTTQVMPGSSLNVVADAKDLKPFTVRLFRCTALRSAHQATAAAQEGGWALFGGYPRRPARRRSDARRPLSHTPFAHPGRAPVLALSRRSRPYWGTSIFMQRQYALDRRQKQRGDKGARGRMSVRVCVLRVELCGRVGGHCRNSDPDTAVNPETRPERAV